MTQQLLDPDFIKSLDRLSLFSRKVFRGLLKGERRSQKKGFSIEFADYRNYVQGDDLRFLDWNILGRLDRLLLRLFQEEEDLNIFILIDNSASMDFGDPNKFLYAKRAAAALGYIALTNLDRVSVATFSNQLQEVFPLTRGKTSTWKLFQSLESANALPHATDLTQAFRSFALKNRYPGMIIILSDFMDPTWESAFKFFSPKKYDVFVIQVLSQEEVNPSLQGDIKLIDVENGEPTDLSITPELLDKYHDILKGFLDHLRSFCHRRDMAYIFAHNQLAIEELLLSYLRQYGLLQ